MSIPHSVSMSNQSGIEQARALFKSTFPVYASSVLFFGSAPGRIEILGNHTDYNEGYILACAIDKHTVFAGTVTDEPSVTLFSEGMDSQVWFPLDDDTRYPEHSPQFWANYPKGVIQQLKPPRGFTGVFTSDIPLGAGVSSSAAIELAMAMFISAAFPETTTATMEEIALACKKAENEFVGMGCGILDQFTSAMGKDGKLVFLDCRDIDKFEYADLPPDYKFVVTDSGAPHQLVDGKYAELRSACFEAAELLHISHLRDISSGKLERRKHRLTPLLTKRASHIVGENERVLKGIQILRSGRKMEEFGELMDQSHRSSQFDFGNSCTELDILVEAAQKIPGCLGSRLQGGGFGGSTLSLVRADAVDVFIQLLAGMYLEKTGIRTTPFAVTPANGATGGKL